MNRSATQIASITQRPRSQPRRFITGSFRFDIEGLRGVAILAGVLYHSGLAVHGGYVGVDVFFVISGFLITSYLFSELSESGNISLARFYARRVRRILPVATVVIVVTLIVTWILASPLDIHSTGLGAITAALFCINYRFAENGTNYFSNTSFSPFQQFWSLAIEEQFYALWPLLLLGVSWSTRRVLSSRRAISIFLVVAIAISLFFSVAQTPTSSSWAYFGLQTRAWELAVGAFVAVNADGLARVLRSVAAPLSWLGLGAIVGTAMLYSGTTSYPGYAALLPVAGAALVIAAGSADQPRGAVNLLGLRPLQYVGRVSYSWYLWHWPVLVFLPYVLGHHATTGVVVVALVISFAIASLSYEIVERPFRQNKDLVTYPRRGLLLGLGFVGISLVTAVMVMTFDVVPMGLGQPAQVTDSATRNVALATQLKQLPSNLSPRLAVASKDYPPPSCFSGLGLDQLPEANCVMGDTAATRTIVLFGDSHAWQWTEPLAAIAAKRGLKLLIYVKPNCGAWEITDAEVLSQVSGTNCEQWRDAAFAQLAALRPAIVVTSSWISEFGTLRANVVAADTANTIATLKADGSKVVYIEDTPNPGFNVLDCLGNNPRHIQACSYRPSSGLNDQGTRKVVDHVAAQNGALVIDPLPWLCTGTVCPPVIGHTSVYFDSEHLSKTFTLTLVPVLSTALSPVMSSR